MIASGITDIPSGSDPIAEGAEQAFWAISPSDIVLPREKRNPYRQCTTSLDGCYLRPDTDPSQGLDARIEKYTVGQSTVGRTHFRPQDGTPWGYNRENRLKAIDAGNAHLTYAGETTKGPYRIDDREVYTTRRAESVACQIGLSEWQRREVCRLISEIDIKPWNWLGGIDAAILGIIAYVFKNGRYVVSRSKEFTTSRVIDISEDA